MKFELNSPARIYRCGQSNEVLISDLGSINLKANECFTFGNPTCDISVSCKDWGFVLELAPKERGVLSFSGTSWKRAHILFHIESEKKLFQQYEDSEHHQTYWQKLVNANTLNSPLMLHRLDVGIDNQLTFRHKNSFDLDITSKIWGAYLTPSLFVRCKKFGLRPFLCEMHESVGILMVFRNKIEIFKNVIMCSEYGSISAIDERLGVTPW